MKFCTTSTTTFIVDLNNCFYVKFHEKMFNLSLLFGNEWVLVIISSLLGSTLSSFVVSYCYLVYFDVSTSTLLFDGNCLILALNFVCTDNCLERGRYVMIFWCKLNI